MSKAFYRMETPRQSSSTTRDVGKVDSTDFVRVTTVPLPFEYNEHGAAERPSAPTRNESFVQRWWLWEFCAWMVCVLALLGIVGFLIPANQKPVPRWVVSSTVKSFTLGFSVSINSIISIFSTAIKSAVMIPVAACIGQLKWLWFADGNKLSDFQRFEGARSGPLSAVLLIWAMRGKQLVCLGALITIGSLAIDFSFQQLVTYPPSPVNVSVAYMPATPTYSNYALSAPSGLDFPPSPIPDSKMMSALKIGLDGINSTIGIVPDCSSGNCTWPEVASLAVCSECFDATEKLIKSCGSYVQYDPPPAPPPETYCNYTWPGSSGFFGISPVLGSAYSNDDSGAYNIFTTSGEEGYNVFFKDIVSPIGILSTIGNTRGNQQPVKVSASQCALFLCVKKFETSVNQTILSEKVVDIHHENTAPLDESGMHLTAPKSFMNGTGHNGSSRFSITKNASIALSVYFGTNAHFSGVITNDPLQQTPTPTDIMAYLWALDQEGLSIAMERLAANMTNAMRMSSPNTPAHGILWQDLPKVNVVWWWLAFPGGLILLSLIFLVLTMTRSSRRGAMLWKGSALAAFYHPLTSDGREKLGRAVGPKDLEKIANGLRVRSVWTGKGNRLVAPQS